MRIVQINAVIEYSSTGRTTSELHTALKNAGYESWVAAPNAPNSSDSIKIGCKADQIFHSIYSHIWGRQGFASYFATRKLISKLNEIKPDIVHLRNLHANFINLPLLIKYLSINQIAVVVTLHDCWFFTGHCCYFTDSNCNNWKGHCGNCPDLKNWNSSFLFDRTKTNLRDKKILFSNISNLAVIGVSKWVTSFVYDSILKNAKIIKPIYNWIDTELFSPKENDIRIKLGLMDEKVVLCIAQSWNKQKGIFDIIKLANIMPEFKFVIVGSIDESIALPSNIISVGITNDSLELANYYSMADVFFNPSSRETFGKVTVEALSCGTPVVAYNTTATPELVPETCGKLVGIGDIHGAKDAILKVVSKSSMKGECRSFAVNTFSKNLIVKQYFDLYKQLLNE